MQDEYHEVKARYGSPDAVRENLDRLANMLLQVAQQAAQQEGVASGTDVRAVMLVNLAARSGYEAERLARWVGEPTDQIAWGARNLFELNLRVRHLLKNKQNVRRFFAESVSDEIELLKAMRTWWCDAADVELRQYLQDRIDTREKRLAKERVVPVEQFLGAAALAGAVGANREYRAFYGLYSKYIHPTGFLVNRRLPHAEEFNKRVKGILLRNAQQYAIDTLQRVAQETGLSQL